MIVAWATFFFVVISGAVLAYAAFRSKQILSVTTFFIKAATVYVLVGEEDARLAAMASGKGASSKDRSRMRDFLRTLATSFQNQKSKRWDRQIQRTNDLIEELESGGGVAAEAIEAREALRIRNDVYSRALRTGDAAVFLRRYPQLFGREAEQAISAGEHPDSTSEDMVADAQPPTQPRQRPAANS